MNQDTKAPKDDKSRPRDISASLLISYTAWTHGQRNRSSLLKTLGHFSCLLLQSVDAASQDIPLLTVRFGGQRLLLFQQFGNLRFQFLDTEGFARCGLFLFRRRFVSIVRGLIIGIVIFVISVSLGLLHTIKNHSSLVNWGNPASVFIIK